MIVFYRVHGKNPHHADAIEQGFKPRVVPSNNGAIRGSFHLIGGLISGADEVLKAVLGFKEPYIFFDRAYFGGGHAGKVLRASYMGYQSHYITEAPSDRRDVFGVKLKPWKQGGNIMICPPSPAVSKTFDAEGVFNSIEARLRKVTDRKIFVSNKGDSTPLEARLDGCWAVVTWSSNVAVEAVCHGVPVFVSRHSAAFPVGIDINEIEKIESPVFPDREKWLDSLCYGQFTLGEISSGFARDTLRNIHGIKHL